MAKKPPITPRSLILSLDYGGTKHTAGIVVKAKRNWLKRESVYSPAGADAKYDQATMLNLARKLLSGVEGRLAAVGVSFGGAVNAAKGVVLLSHHIPGWENTHLRDLLQKEFGVPAAIENDAHCGAFGEFKFGAGQNCASLLYVTVSTGIGGGWILDGKIFPGADGTAGQIGHIVVRPGGAECMCGKRGCLEAEASGTAIAKKMRELMRANPPENCGAGVSSAVGARQAAARAGRASPAPTMRRPEARATIQITGESVAAAALKGDPLAMEVMDDAAAMLGAGIGGAINLINPERVILGGGVTKSGERWWRIVRETARANALPEMRVDIQPASLGDDAPLWGAVALAEKML